VFSIVGGAALAQPANEEIKGLESCFQAARLADAICSNSANGPVQRLDCFQKARAAQLECLENVASGMAAGPTLPEHPSGTVPTAPTAAAPDLPKDTRSPEKSVQTLLPEKPSGAVSSGEPASSSPIAPGPVLPMAPAVTSLPDLPTGAISEDMSAKLQGVPAKPPPPPDWVVSETTSPVDFSPIITMTLVSQSSVRDASDILTVRCRGKRTELLVRSEPGRAADAGEVQVAYQINDQSSVRLAWTASADGKTISYKEDAVGFLQSLPEGAKLKISLPDKSRQAHEAIFQLIGWDIIREKLKTACGWSPIAGKSLSRNR
jgi:hypothetical protein